VLDQARAKGGRVGIMPGTW